MQIYNAKEMNISSSRWSNGVWTLMGFHYGKLPEEGDIFLAEMKEGGIGRFIVSKKHRIWPMPDPMTMFHIDLSFVEYE